MTNIADPNWFRRNKATFARLLGPLAGSPVHYLEIGVCAGFSLLWVAQNVLTHPDSRAVGIDLWDLNPALRVPKRRAYRWEVMARKRLAPFGEKIEFRKGCSKDVLTAMQHTHAGYFDVAYIDGGHLYDEVITDSRLTWPLAKAGALVIWDDAWLTAERTGGRKSVKEALGFLLAEWAGRYETVVPLGGKQVWLRKLI